MLHGICFFPNEQRINLELKIYRRLCGKRTLLYFSTKLLSCYIIIHLAYLCGVRVHLEIFPAFQKEREEQEQV